MGRVLDDRYAVRVRYQRRSHRLVFNGRAVPTVPAAAASDTEENGPLPVATYLIDTYRVHESIGCEWFNLHAPLEDGTGYYGYGDRWYTFRNRRSGFGLHPGTRSNGCVTISGPYDSSNWEAVQSYVASGYLAYLGNNGKIRRFAVTWQSRTIR